MKVRVLKLALLSLMVVSVGVYADSMTVKLATVAPGNQVAKPVGSVTLSDTKYGLLITPNLQNLSPGWHGFHIHQNPSCADNGEAAGPHLDPKDTTHHLGPYAQGHLGDLPALSVQDNGTATQAIMAPRLTVAELKGHSLIIHANGDNYADQPLPLGGGGARVICGVVK